jgi:putative ABC transport system permease protein
MKLRGTINRYFHNIEIAVEAILDNKLKSLLTALGIIFGVAAVISMLAIGNGARQEILKQMELVGVNNIIISPLEKGDEEGGEEASSRKFSRGLHLSDVRAIQEILPSVKNVTPEIGMDVQLVGDGKRQKSRLLGVNSAYFRLFKIRLEEGELFSDFQMDHGMPVCIIGGDIRKRMFPKGNPLNQYLKCGKVWLKVIGVIESRPQASETTLKLGISNRNDKVYVPTRTMLLRYQNRSLVTRKSLDEKEERSSKPQLDKIIVQVRETDQLVASSEILNRMLLRRHSGVEDFEIKVPEMMLKQQQRTKDIFNIVLGAIAGISLLVGGIGIMNIMLASVWERIKEIGTRQALGATQKDIIVQFLAESTLISMCGGAIGVLLGVLLAGLITRIAAIETIVSPGSVLVAFGVSVTVGIAFGYMPAQKAARQDPVVSLRN